MLEHAKHIQAVDLISRAMETGINDGCEDQQLVFAMLQGVVSYAQFHDVSEERVREAMHMLWQTRCGDGREGNDGYIRRAWTTFTDPAQPL